MCELGGVIPICELGEIGEAGGGDGVGGGDPSAAGARAPREPSSHLCVPLKSQLTI